MKEVKPNQIPMKAKKRLEVYSLDTHKIHQEQLHSKLTS